MVLRTQENSSVGVPYISTLPVANEHRFLCRTAAVDAIVLAKSLAYFAQQRRVDQSEGEYDYLKGTGA